MAEEADTQIHWNECDVNFLDLTNETRNCENMALRNFPDSRIDYIFVWILLVYY